jgi:hypothetical protein
MRHSIAILLALVLGVLVYGSTVPEPACAYVGQGCGIMPVKPVTPVGCRNLCASCQCDATGSVCNWVWNCC